MPVTKVLQPCFGLWHFIKGCCFERKPSRKQQLLKRNQLWKGKTRLNLLAVCIITEPHLSILSQGLTKPLATSTLREGKKVTAVLPPCSYSLPFYLEACGLTSTRPHQTLQLCLHILLGDRKKNPILHRAMVHFFSFSFFVFIYYLRHGRNKTYRESDWAKLPALYTWPCFLNYLPSAAPLKEAESVLYVPSNDSCEAIHQVWFSRHFFNALLVCPLISPPERACLSTHLKYSLTCDNFVRRTSAIFSKAKLQDKRWLWVYLSWNVYVACLGFGWWRAPTGLCLQHDQ